MHRTGKTGMAKLNNFLFILPVTVLVVFAFFSAKGYIPVILLSFISISGILAYITVRFNLQVLLLKSIALTLPFSLEIPFFMNSMMRLPGEPLIMIAAITLIIEAFRQPKRNLTTPCIKNSFGCSLSCWHSLSVFLSLRCFLFL